MENVIVIVEKTDTGYSAYTEDLIGCVAAGDTFESVKENMREAIDFHLEGLVEFDEVIPEKFQDDYELIFDLDLYAFFDWVSGMLTRSGIANISGLNASLVSQYANGLKTPSKRQLKKIEKGIHQFGADLQAITL
ncbi:hypothetical protein BZG02_02685 [Labilibaculum filiforme]|uniref:HicB-like antitoxin of toxin-antitoxin system domain-containing protein n=1 Tax=Labilibaculum filiforme TaxID=1940526 RepID=A0A2N3I3A1_9BACT|nr:type II toxin-antitoxin system HicB family antitoxin [Labilibaculum filiforme]PKQ64785.1 hypothetical protein BZG02_02685 [Labilibaculum filiforme]